MQPTAFGDYPGLASGFGLALLLALAPAALADDVLITGEVLFSNLDGSAEDDDGSVDGVFTVNDNLTVSGTVECSDDRFRGRDSACPITIAVGGELVLEAGSGIFAEHRKGRGDGGDVTLEVGGDLILRGATASLPGAVVSSSRVKPGGRSGSTAGDLRFTAGGGLLLGPGAVIAASAAGRHAGAIELVAGGAVRIDGLIAAGPSRTLRSTLFSGRVLSGGQSHQAGGPISVVSTGTDCPAITVGGSGVVVSEGAGRGAGPVLLEGCGLEIFGLVASVSRRQGPSGVVLRSGKGILIDGRDLDQVSSSSGLPATAASLALGRVRADATAEGAAGYRVDLLAAQEIVVLGPDPAATPLFAVTSQPGFAEERPAGGTVTLLSLDEGVTASGNAFAVGRQGEENEGGAIELQAAADVLLDDAVLVAVGGLPATGGGDDDDDGGGDDDDDDGGGSGDDDDDGGGDDDDGGGDDDDGGGDDDDGGGGDDDDDDGDGGDEAGAGGRIAVRSFQGSVSWLFGAGDVRPVGDGVAAASQGSITLTYCVAVDTAGTLFPTVGDPILPFPDEVEDCSLAAPSLPAGEPPLPVCNAPPVAEDDAFEITEDELVTGDLLADNGNGPDVDPDSDPLSVVEVNGNPASIDTEITLPSGALLTVNGNGTFTYDPRDAFDALTDGEVESDGFTYTLSDDSGATDTATVTLTINGVDDCPTAVDDAVSTDEDTPLAGDVLADNGGGPDLDPEGEALSVILVDGAPFTSGVPFALPSGALLTMSGSGTFTYDPNGQFDALPEGGSGLDSFTYTIDDASGGCAETATVSVTLSGVNDPPVANDDAYETIGNTLLEVSGAPSVTPAVFVLGSLLANDSEVDGPGPLTVTLNGSSPGALVAIDAVTGELTYLPPLGATGLDSFTYDLSDGLVAVTGTVSIDLDERVWYVDNTAAGGGIGRSADPFDTLAAAEAASAPGDTLFLFTGSGTAGQDQGITLQADQRLLGEGVGLSVDVGRNGNPAPTELVAPGVEPEITHSSLGDGVTVADVSGVEIAGLDLSGDDNAVDVSASGTASAGVRIHDNTVSGAGAAGIRVDLGSSGDLEAVVEDNTLAAGGSALDARTSAPGAGTLTLALNRNTGITGGGSGILVDGTAGGTVTITDFAANAVAPATGMEGVLIRRARFDANPATAGFEPVLAGDLGIGAAGSPVGTDGLRLLDVAGDLAFGQLEVFNANGQGIEASSSGGFDAASGTGLRLSASGGSLESAGGAHALRLDTVTLDASGLILDTVTSSGSTRGVEMIGVAGGALAIGGGTLSSGAEVLTVSGSSAAVSLAGVALTRTTGGGPAILGVDSTGTVSSSGSISHAGGRLVDFSNMDGGSDFTGTVVTPPAGSDHHGVRLVESAGLHRFPEVVIGTPPPAGVDAIFLQDNAGSVSFGRIAVTTSGSRGLAAANGGILDVTGSPSSITTSGATAILLSSTDVGAAGVTFASLSASATGAGNPGIAFDGVGGGSFQVTGTATVNGTGGTAAGIDIAGSAASFTFASVDVDATGGSGIALSANGGPVVIGGGAVSAAAGPAVDVDQGSATVSYAGTIDNSAGRSVEVTNRSGGTVTLGGSITDSGAGVLLDANSGATISLSGGMTLTTGSDDAFTATGGGTVNVTGTNTVETTTGVGVRITATTIGVSGVGFRSLSVDGAPSGIILADTGSTGGFTVTGDGTLVRNGSGGTIRNTTGDGVELTNATGVTLRQMNILGAGSSANPANTTAAVNDHALESRGGGNIVLSAVHVRDPIGSGWEAFDLTGVNRIDNDSLFEALDRTSNFAGFRLRNTDTDFASVTLDSVTFDHADPTPGDAATNGNAMVVLSTRGTSSGTWVVSSSTFTGARGQAMTLGVGDTVGSSGTVTTSITGSTFEAAHPVFGQNNLGLSALQSTTHNVAVSGNTFRDLGRGLSNSGQIILQKAESATVDASISGNTLHQVVAQRGIEVLSLSSSAGGRVDAEITGNFVYDLGREGIFVSARGGEPDMDVRIMGNSIGRDAGGTVLPVGGQNGGPGILVDAQGSSRLDVQIDANDVIASTDTFGSCGGSNCGVLTLNVENFPSGAALVNATVEGNTLTNNTGGGTNLLARARDCGLTLNLDLGGGAGGGDGLPNTATGTTTTFDVLDDSFGCGGSSPTVAVENLPGVSNDNLPAGSVSTSGVVGFAGDVPRPDF